MSHLYENLELAFDLSYLQKEEFPTSQIKTVGIIGGGTAGYFAALALKKSHPDMIIELIESQKIPVIGVGESTTTEILPFLHGFLGFDPIEFFKEVEPTLKLGIEFDWGQKKKPSFHFNFFASHHHDSYFYEGHIKNSNLASVMMENQKIPVMTDDEGAVISLLSRIPFAYHIENKKFVSYLRKKVDQAGIKVIDARITEVVRKPGTGEIEKVVDESSHEYSYGLYVDCTGFRSSLLGDALQTPFVSYADTLITDRAIAFELENKGEIAPFTKAITMKNGWCWKIPMRDEDHYGYVHSSKFCSVEQAVQEIEERFGKISSHRVIDFKSGRYEKAWNKNVFAVGNSYGFVEPLESTAIQSIIYSTMLLCRLMPRSLEDTSSIAGLNKEIAANWDSFRWFLGAHYKFNYKMESEFWSWCREHIEIGHAQQIFDLFQAKAPLSNGHYGTTTGFAAYEPLVFNSYSYDSLFFGQNLIGQSQLPVPALDEANYKERVKAYDEICTKAMTQKQLFANTDLLYKGLLPDLFEDPDSWVADTSI